MMGTIFGLFKTVFSECAVWTNQLFDAVGGKGVVISAFILVVIVSLLFIPLRGRTLVVSPGDFMDFTANVTYKPKHAQGKESKKKVWGGSRGRFSERHYKFNGTRR